MKQFIEISFFPYFLSYETQIWLEKNKKSLENQTPVSVADQATEKSKYVSEVMHSLTDHPYATELPSHFLIVWL